MVSISKVKIGPFRVNQPKYISSVQLKPAFPVYTNQMLDYREIWQNNSEIDTKVDRITNDLLTAINKERKVLHKQSAQSKIFPGFFILGAIFSWLILHLPIGIQLDKIYDYLNNNLSNLTVYNPNPVL